MTTTSRWDHDLPHHQHEQLIGRAMALLSLEATRTMAADLAVDPAVLAFSQPDIRRVLTPALQSRLADPAFLVPWGELHASVDARAHTLVQEFYDRVLRYNSAQDAVLFCWRIVLARCASDDRSWDALGLPTESLGPLRDALRASGNTDDIQTRAEAALAPPLSEWDRFVASAKVLRPSEDGAPGIGDQVLASPAKVVREQFFWRTAANLLGAQGLRALHVKAQAFLATQQDIASAFEQLFDPWLLAHPEVPLASSPSFNLVAC
jgi:hypothetical protein